MAPDDSHFPTCNYIKKETLAQVFSCEFCEASKNTFFTEHLWTTASVHKIILRLAADMKQIFTLLCHSLFFIFVQ